MVYSARRRWSRSRRRPAGEPPLAVDSETGGPSRVVVITRSGESHPRTSSCDVATSSPNRSRRAQRASDDATPIAVSRSSVAANSSATRTHRRECGRRDGRHRAIARANDRRCRWPSDRSCEVRSSGPASARPARPSVSRARESGPRGMSITLLPVGTLPARATRRLRSLSRRTMPRSIVDFPEPLDPTSRTILPDESERTASRITHVDRGMFVDSCRVRVVMPSLRQSERALLESGPCPPIQMSRTGRLHTADLDGKLVGRLGHREHRGVLASHSVQRNTKAAARGAVGVAHHNHRLRNTATQIRPGLCSANDEVKVRRTNTCDEAANTLADLSDRLLEQSSDLRDRLVVAVHRADQS